MDSFSKPIILTRMSSREFTLIFQQYLYVFNKRKEFTSSIFNILVHFLEFEGESISNNQLEAFKLTFEQANPLILPIETLNGQLYINYYGKRY